MRIGWQGVFPAVCTQFRDDYSLDQTCVNPARFQQMVCSTYVGLKRRQWIPQRRANYCLRSQVKNRVVIG